MNEILTRIDGVVTAISGVLYMPWVPLFLIVAGLFFTFRTKLIQIRLLPESLRVVMEKPKNSEGISSFGALMVSTASRVGTGNIVGVSTAICLGGYGAVFWMWITAILGGASAFIESTLAQVYKRKDKKGHSYGGPSYYMESALGQRWLGVIFAVIIILTYAVGYNMLASYNLQSAFAGFSFYGDHTAFVIGLILAILFAICVLGGAHRLTKVTGALVPIMGVFYVIIAIVVVVMHANLIPGVFKNIFVSAFDFPAIFGGFTGSCMMQGIKRGLYSNEAGMGSAPNAAATADVSHPAKQGLVQALGVYFDTLVVCTASAMLVLLTPGWADSGKTGIELIQQTLTGQLGTWTNAFMSVTVLFFAFSSIIGNYFYGEINMDFISRHPAALWIYRAFVVMMVYLGSVASLGLVWNLADLFMALMAIVNLVAIAILGKYAFIALDDYVSQKKRGILNPEFDPSVMPNHRGILCWPRHKEEEIEQC